MSTCDAIACAETKGRGMFMCSRHWRLLPKDLQRTINSRNRAAYCARDLLTDPIYLRACVDAIDGLAKAESKQGVSAYHRLMAIAEQRAAEKKP